MAKSYNSGIVLTVLGGITFVVADLYNFPIALSAIGCLTFVIGVCIAAYSLTKGDKYKPDTLKNIHKSLEIDYAKQEDSIFTNPKRELLLAILAVLILAAVALGVITWFGG